MLRITACYRVACRRTFLAAPAAAAPGGKTTGSSSIELVMPSALTAAASLRDRAMATS